MDRSNFYYDQEVRESELDQAYDDVERMEQDKVIELDLWGVWTGMTVAEQAAPDLTVKVSAGAAHDELGRRIVMDASDDVDLTSYVPSTAGWQRIVHIYAKNNDTLSDSRTDGHGASIDYRLTETYELVVEAGSQASPPAAAPSIVANQVLLAEVELNYGDTQIFDADITAVWSTTVQTRHEGGVALLHGRKNTNEVFFGTAASPGDPGLNLGERRINNVGHIELLPGASGGLGIDANNCDIVEVKSISMQGSGTGIDMNNTAIAEVASISMDSGGAGIDTNGADIEMDAGDIFSSGGAITEANEVSAVSPDPGHATPKGHLYRTTAGALSEVSKYLDYDALAMVPMPGDDNTDPWLAKSGDVSAWYMYTNGPTPLAGYALEWRYNIYVPTNTGTFYLHGLGLALTGLPYGASLSSVIFRINMLGTEANAEFGVGLWRRDYEAGGTNHTLINNGGSITWGSESSGNQIVQADVDGSYDIIDNSNYVYFAIFLFRIISSTTIDPGRLFNCEVDSARAYYKIREAGGVHTLP